MELVVERESLANERFSSHYSRGDGKITMSRSYFSRRRKNDVKDMYSVSCAAFTMSARSKEGLCRHVPCVRGQKRKEKKEVSSLSFWCHVCREKMFSS